MIYPSVPKPPGSQKGIAEAVPFFVVRAEALPFLLIGIGSFFSFTYFLGRGLGFDYNRNHGFRNRGFYLLR